MYYFDKCFLAVKPELVLYCPRNAVGHEKEVQLAVVQTFAIQLRFLAACLAINELAANSSQIVRQVARIIRKLWREPNKKGQP